nr:MAG TPA: hypothetical protein [Microviridae sp.]
MRNFVDQNTERHRFTVRVKGMYLSTRLKMSFLGAYRSIMVMRLKLERLHNCPNIIAWSWF